MGKVHDEHRKKERAAARSELKGRRETFRRIKASVVGIVNAPADIDAALRRASYRAWTVPVYI